MAMLSILLRRKEGFSGEENPQDEFMSLPFSEQFINELCERTMTCIKRDDPKEIEVISQVKSMADSLQLYLDLKEGFDEKFLVQEMHLNFYQK